MKTYGSFRKGKQKQDDDKPYKIKVTYEHGSDFNTVKIFSFETEEQMREILKLLIKVRNFIPNAGWENLGYYEPITKDEKLSEIIDEDTIDKITGWYIQRDKYYKDRYAVIEGISVKINDENYVLFDSVAAETDIIDLPKPGDMITVDAEEDISGYGPSIFDKDKEYLPNSGIKDYIKPSFEVKIVDCKISEFDYMKDGIEYFQYIILFETEEKVLESGEDIYYGTINFSGWDKNFGKKYNKDKFDDLRIYVL